ncbi:hypothetical protein OEM_09360 [Mycobacterium intracellulare subsp. yongonense 05-1390]|nr:hypothetical protein OEM_09360 [Mycobacterium intracellulare subsp. yongonense 05-1390]ARR76617.1 hypothetical protein MOTT12_00953 [Mycobacterium intracellulare subsp. yongonense]
MSATSRRPLGGPGGAFADEHRPGDVAVCCGRRRDPPPTRSAVIAEKFAQRSIVTVTFVAAIPAGRRATVN